MQVEEMIKIMDTTSLPTILMGDMNCNTTSTEVFNPLFEHFYDSWIVGEGEGRTYPSDNPTNRIDYILLNQKIKAIKAYNKKTLASDHIPLIVDTELY